MEDCKLMDTPMITNMKKVITSNSKLVDPRIYRKLIGSLMYLFNTRLDIYFSMNTLSQFMVDELYGYLDSDCSGNVVDRNTTSGCYFILGSTMITWFSVNDNFVSLSLV
jgi:hypothetical protein